MGVLPTASSPTSASRFTTSAGQPGRNFYATELIALAGAGSGGVQRELAWLARSGLVTLSLFGSAARNELTPASDVDLLVEFDPKSKVTLFDLPGIQEAFSPLFGNRRIDLATPEILVNPFRRRAIESDLKVLYAA